MSKKSLLIGTIIIAILGLAGMFLLSPEQALADIAISSELGGQSTNHTDTGGEVSITTPDGDIAVSDEVDSQTGTSNVPGGEGEFTTPDDGGGGGGGGGGRRRIRPTATTTTCVYPYLTKYIKFGQANDPVEVAKLQRFLHDFQGFENVAVTGIYDQPTLTAVMAFQRRYADDVLQPWGLTAEQPTGYVFITTSLVINRLYCNYSTKHNLDLRNVYDKPAPKAAVGKTGAGVKIIQPIIIATTTCPTTTATTAGNGDQTAAVGFLNFLKDNLWFWLIPLLVLILIFAGYYLWRERPQEFKDYDHEVRIKEEEQEEEAP